MEKGEAPSEEIEREWEKMIRNEERKSKDLANAAMVQLLYIQKSASGCRSWNMVVAICVILLFR